MAKELTKEAKPVTSAQVVVDMSTGELALPRGIKFDDIRKMRKDPTISLARRFAVAPAVASTWTVEGSDDDHKSYVSEQFQPLRADLIRTAMYGEIDFGWKAYELLFPMVEFTFPNGEQRILQGVKIKPLKNDFTRVRYEKETGKFMGLAHDDQYTGTTVHIDAMHSLFVNFDDEGVGEYATGSMEIAHCVWEAWNEANEGASRYDKKMAGTFLVVWHPVGTTKYNGVETDNAEIAMAIIKAIRASGSVAIPIETQDLVNDLKKENRAWHIEFLDPQAKQASFVDRMKYLDALKARAFAVPERAILEGEFGTKAEAGVHASAALLNMQLKYEMITEFLNRHLVNRLLSANFDAENTASLRAMPLTDERAALFAEIFKALMADAGIGPEILDKLDIDEMMEVLGVPVIETAEHIQPADGEESDTETVATIGVVDAEPEEGSDPSVILNGAQIQSAVELLNQVSSKLLPIVVAEELLRALGIPKKTAERMAMAAASKPIPMAVAAPQAAQASPANGQPTVTIS